MKLIYLNIGKSSIFDSQVGELLKYYEKSGGFEKIILLYGWKNESEIDVIRGKFSGSDINLRFFKAYPNYPVLEYLTIKSIVKIIKSIINLDEYIIHVRGELPGYYLLKVFQLMGFRKNGILIDVRGASIEEIEIYSTLPGILKAAKIKLYESAIDYLKKKKIHFTAVSRTLKSYLVEKGFQEANIDIVHGLAGNSFKYDPEKRQKTRGSLKLKDSDICIIFSSSGSANWQKDKAILDLLEVNSSVKILNLAKKRIDHGKVINKFVPYSEMPDYLCAADLGLLIRDDNVVNHVACPVKLVEYFSCGLPVIHNNTVNIIQDYPELNKNFISWDNIAQLKESSDTTARQDISNTTNGIFSINAISAKYKEIYITIESSDSLQR